MASAMPAVKSHAATLGSGTALRCRNPRGQRQLRPLLALLKGADVPQLRGLRLRRRPRRGSGLCWDKGSGDGPGHLVGLDAPVHPASSMATSIASSPNSPSAMAFDKVVLPDAGFSATLGSTLTLCRRGRKVLVPMAGGTIV